MVDRLVNLLYGFAEFIAGQLIVSPELILKYSGSYILPIVYDIEPNSKLHF